MSWQATPRSDFRRVERCGPLALRQDLPCCEQIVKLDVATRFQLAQDLLDSVASETFATPLTPEQRTELRARLAHHRAHPDEPTFTLAEIKAKAGIK